MQKNYGLISFQKGNDNILAPKSTSKLPSFTARFVCELCGKVITGQNLPNPSNFSSLSQMISKDELDFFLLSRKTCDKMIFSLSDSQKGYLLLSKTEKDLFYALVLTYSEENCPSLEEYIQKLTLYNEYMKDFYGVAAFPTSAGSAPDVFTSYLSGAFEILNLCTGEKEENERKYTFSLDVLTEKILSLLRFSAKGKELCVTRDSALLSRQAILSLKEVRLLICLMSLVCRHGKKDTLKVQMTLEEETAFIFLEVEQSARRKKDGIFDKAIIDSSARFLPLVVQSEGKYKMSLRVKTVAEKGISVSDRDFAVEMLEKTLCERSLADALTVVAG